MNAYEVAHLIARRRHPPATGNRPGNSRGTLTPYDEDKLKQEEAQKIADLDGVDKAREGLAEINTRAGIEDVLRDLLSLAIENGSYPLRDEQVTVASDTFKDLFPTVWNYLETVVPIILPSFKGSELPNPQVDIIVYDPVIWWIEDKTLGGGASTETYEDYPYVDFTLHQVYIYTPSHHERTPSEIRDQILSGFDKQPKKAKLLVHEYQHTLQAAAGEEDSVYTDDLFSEDLGRKQLLGKRLAKLFLSVKSINKLLSGDQVEFLETAAKEEYAMQSIEWDARLAEYIYCRLSGQTPAETLNLMSIGIKPDDLDTKIKAFQTKLKNGEEPFKARSRLKFFKAFRDDLDTFLEIGEDLVEKVRDEKADWWDERIWKQASDIEE